MAYVSSIIPLLLKSAYPKNKKDGERAQFPSRGFKQTTCSSLAFPSKVIVAILANWHTLLATQNLKTSSCGSQSWTSTRTPGRAKKTQIPGPLPWSVSFSRYRAGPENLQQVPTWCWCYWSRHHALGSKARCFLTILNTWGLLSHINLSHASGSVIPKGGHRTKWTGWFSFCSSRSSICHAAPTLHLALCVLEGPPLLRGCINRYPCLLASSWYNQWRSHLRRTEKMGHLSPGHRRLTMKDHSSRRAVLSLQLLYPSYTTCPHFVLSDPGKGATYLLPGPWHKTQIQCLLH